LDPEAVTASEVELRLIQAVGELGPVTLLAGEYAEWVRGRVLAEYGFELEFESARDLFLDLEGLRQPRARLYVAEVVGEPIGMGGLRPLTADDAEIKRMYVRPSARGQGAGRAILQRLIDDARGLGYRTIHLDSAPFMHEAQTLYRSFGFAPSTQHEGFEFERLPAVREITVFMRLDLGPN
jgi:GNAT superfamily N-acetyltransferase